jgi:hypothetical protein
MPQAAGEGPHRVEGVEERDEFAADVESDGRNPGNRENQPDEGPTMSGAGAEPAGNAMDHWATAMPNTDATKPETMPNTESEPLPGETEERDPV